MRGERGMPGPSLSSRHMCSWVYWFEISITSSNTHTRTLMSLPSVFCFIHPHSPSHASLPSTRESPNSITAGQQWEANSAAQVQLKGILICNMSFKRITGEATSLQAALQH